MMHLAVCLETNQSECVFDLQEQTDPNTKLREDVCRTEVSHVIH